LVVTHDETISAIYNLLTGPKSTIPLEVPNGMAAGFWVKNTSISRIRFQLGSEGSWEAAVESWGEDEHIPWYDAGPGAGKSTSRVASS
jgi:broad specificity phosphatase PhoE